MVLWAFMYKILFGHVFISLGWVCRSGIAESHDHAMFNTLRNCKVIFQSDCRIFHSPQQCILNFLWYRICRYFPSVIFLLLYSALWSTEFSALMNPHHLFSFGACALSVSEARAESRVAQTFFSDCRNFIFYISVQLSHSAVSNSLRPHGLQHSRPPCPSPAPEAHSNSCPSSRWGHPTISPSVVPFSSRLQPSPDSLNLFQWINSSHQVAKYCSFSYSISASSEYSGLISFPGWISQESSATPQYKSINSLALIFLCSPTHPTLTSIHEYWKDHSFD